MEALIGNTVKLDNTELAVICEPDIESRMGGKVDEADANFLRVARVAIKLDCLCRGSEGGIVSLNNISEKGQHKVVAGHGVTDSQPGTQCRIRWHYPGRHMYHHRQQPPSMFLHVIDPALKPRQNQATYTVKVRLRL